MSQSLILIGFKSCGKTYFGKKLSEILKVPFVDTDQLLEQKHALNSQSLWKKLGECQFRVYEKQATQTPLPEACVVATGGGTDTAELRKKGPLVYLKSSLDKIKPRIAPDFLNGADLDELYKRRAPVYSAVSDYELSLDDHSEEEVLLELKEIWEQVNGKQ